MSATKEFLYDLQEYVWLLEFAELNFEQRGRARQLFDNFMITKFPQVYAEGFNDWFDTAYELIEIDGGKDWATGKHAERLLGLVSGELEGNLEGVKIAN
jgi:hypothetical protein